MTATVGSSADTTVELDTITLTAPDPDDEPDHIVCCNPRIALCGLDATDMPWTEPNLYRTCHTCLARYHEPCGAPLCRWRTWLRRHLGRH